MLHLSSEVSSGLSREAPKAVHGVPSKGDLVKAGSGRHFCRGTKLASVKLQFSEMVRKRCMAVYSSPAPRSTSTGSVLWLPPGWFQQGLKECSFLISTASFTVMS